jgi:prephenate dehydrogenase
MKLALIGVGLIGGSFAQALRDAGAAGEIVGFDTDAAALATAVERGVLNSVAADEAAAARGADLVVVATPVGAVRAILARIADVLEDRTIVTDVGSTKESVVADAAATLGRHRARFVPAHPIAGGERPGVVHADADLFKGRLAITTPTADTDPDALERVESLWRRAGARIERLTPAEHDRIFAAVSHLPHVLAFALVDMLAASPDAAACFAHAGAGFRDFTRIAASSPDMWRDICLANRGPLAECLRTFRARLAELEASIEAGDGRRLQATFLAAALARRERQG